MRRYYSIPIVATAVSAAIDLYEVTAGTGKPFRLVELVIGQSSDYGDAQAEGLAVQIKRASTGFTSGSGGSSATPVPHRSGSNAFSGVAETCNTTQAIAGGGTLTTLRAEAFNVQGGYQYLQPEPEDDQGNDERMAYLFAPGETCIVSMTLPADAITVSATAVIEEVE